MRTLVRSTTKKGSDMGCGCGKKKTPEEVLAAQKLAEARRQVLKDRLDALVWSLTALGLSEWRVATVSSASTMQRL